VRKRCCYFKVDYSDLEYQIFSVKYKGPIKAKFHQSGRSKASSKTWVFDKGSVLLDSFCDLLRSSELFVSKI